MVQSKENDDFPHYAEILSKVALKVDQLEIVQTYKIPKLIN